MAQIRRAQEEEERVAAMEAEAVANKVVVKGKAVEVMRAAEDPEGYFWVAESVTNLG